MGSAIAQGLFFIIFATLIISYLATIKKYIHYSENKLSYESTQPSFKFYAAWFAGLRPVVLYRTCP